MEHSFTSGSHSGAVSDVTFELTAFRVVSQESGMGVSTVPVSIVGPQLHFS